MSQSSGRAVEIVPSATHRERLAALVGEDEVEHVLGLVVRAGAAEALAQATGEAVFSSMSDLRMYRVYRLLDGGMSLDESEQLVATLFKMTPAGARRVVSATLARYVFELQGSARDALAERFDAANYDGDGKWEVILPPGFVRDAATAMWSRGTQPNPEPKQGAVYKFKIETFDWMRAQLGLEKMEAPKK